MVFVDKTKTITYDTEVSPPTIIDQSTNNNHNVCSKCHTQNNYEKTVPNKAHQHSNHTLFGCF